MDAAHQIPENALVNTFRLSLVFQAVHAQTGGEHENEDCEYGRKELLPFAVQYFGYEFERVVISIDAEQPEYPHDSQQSECYGPRWKKDREVIGRNESIVYDPCKEKTYFRTAPGPPDSGYIYLAADNLRT